MRGRQVEAGLGQLPYLNCGKRGECGREMHTLVDTIVTIGAWRCTILTDFIIITIRRPQRPGRVGRASAGPSSRSRRPNLFAFSNVSSSPGSRPRAGLRLPRFLPISLGGTGVGMSSFRVIVIVEGSREWSRAGGGARADGGLLGAVGGAEREEREE